MLKVVWIDLQFNCNKNNIVVIVLLVCNVMLSSTPGACLIIEAVIGKQMLIFIGQR